MSVVSSDCMDYVHLFDTDRHGKFVCRAFPDGIPIDCMFRKEQNKNEYCNNGIKFLEIK